MAIGEKYYLHPVLNNTISLSAKNY